MNGEILFPGHARWVDFMIVLTSPPYLDFHHVGGDRPIPPYTAIYNFDAAGLAWACPHTDDKPFAREALRELGGVDVEATLAQWPDLCDCDLVFKLGDEEEE